MEFEKFKRGKKIGEGIFGDIMLMIDIKEGENYACKTWKIDKIFE